MIKLTNIKLILSGSIIESYRFTNKPLAYGFDVSAQIRARRKKAATDEERNIQKIESRKRSMRRAGSTMRKLVNANAWQWKSPLGLPYPPILVTLTFKNDIRDIKTANAYFSHFIKRLNYVVSGGFKKGALKYVSVIEFQDLSRGGVVHYHVIFFNLPLGDGNIIQEAWTHGFVNYKKIDNIPNAGAYISKYVSACSSDGRLDKCKRYFSSRGLLQPIEIREQNKAQTIDELIPKEYKAEEDFFEGYQGRVKRVCYRLDKGETLSEIIPGLNELL